MGVPPGELVITKYLIQVAPSLMTFAWSWCTRRLFIFFAHISSLRTSENNPTWEVYEWVCFSLPELWADFLLFWILGYLLRYITMHCPIPSKIRLPIFLPNFCHQKRVYIFKAEWNWAWDISESNTTRKWDFIYCCWCNICN